ncbi:MAG TPA: tetratricopeptide repeat protein [Sunxiuqinia sp.]|nr:tetratricopeptide repeat protein [Sunxiuqinia sp.]
MKRIFLAVALVMFVAVGFAQEAVDAVKMKNDGNGALRSKNYKKALGLYEKAIANWGDEKPDNAMIYNAGYCAYKTKDFKKAVQYFGQSIDNNYKVSTAVLYKANSMRLSGDVDGFEQTLEKGIADNPNNPKMKDMLATHYLKEGNAIYKKGAKILQAAAADVTAGKYKTTDDKYKQAAANAKVEFKKALPYFEKALKIAPNDDTAKQLKDACMQAIKS